MVVFIDQMKGILMTYFIFYNRNNVINSQQIQIRVLTKIKTPKNSFFWDVESSNMTNLSGSYLRFSRPLFRKDL